MYKSIVVGTDGSATASEAVRQAALLASLTGATLHVVHAFQTAGSVASMAIEAGAAAGAVGLAEVAGLAEDVEAAAKQVLQRAGEACSRTGVAVETHLLPGDAAGALVAAAEANSADVIVVGNKGMTGLRRVLGSVPNKVSHHAPCNVLIVNTAL